MKLLVIILCSMGVLQTTIESIRKIKSKNIGGFLASLLMLTLWTISVIWLIKL